MRLETSPLHALPPDVQRLSRRLAEHFAALDPTVELFLVGGLVRDALLGAPRGRDLDFATSAQPRASELALRRAGGAVFTVGERFGTIGAVFESGSEPIQVEITTYRAEAYQPGSRKPDVTFRRHLADDLSRRDFTINAI